MSSTQTPEQAAAHGTVRLQEDIVTSSTGRRVLALARLFIGFTFLWAFLDKTFGLGYATSAPVSEGEPSLSWLDGGSPTTGFLTFAINPESPLVSFFNGITGSFADWLFMIGLLAIGLAMMLGIGLRVAAVSGSVLLAFMWIAEWPLTQGSNNPLIDSHVHEAMLLIIAAVLLSGDTWGLGKMWARLPIIQSQKWLR